MQPRSAWADRNDVGVLWLCMDLIDGGRKFLVAEDPGAVSNDGEVEVCGAGSRRPMKKLKRKAAGSPVFVSDEETLDGYGAVERLEEELAVAQVREGAVVESLLQLLDELQHFIAGHTRTLVTSLAFLTLRQSAWCRVVPGVKRCWMSGPTAL